MSGMDPEIQRSRDPDLWIQGSRDPLLSCCPQRGEEGTDCRGAMGKIKDYVLSVYLLGMLVLSLAAGCLAGFPAVNFEFRKK